MERLVDALASVVSAPLGDPLQPEWISVSSSGMERWLGMELAKRLGVWANPAFPFPRRLLEQVFARVLGESAANVAAYEPASLLFSLAVLLREHAASPDLLSLQHYLASDVHGRRRIALAERIAHLFDQYGTYRPELLLGWERGEGDDFQAFLFRVLARKHSAAHMAARAQRLLRALQAGKGPIPGLPERISVFGVSTLPPLHVELLAALAQRVEVHVFLLSPCREYYADLRSERELDAELRRRGRDRDDDLDALHLGGGHPLLASLGRHGRELQEVLEAQARYREAPTDLYEDPGTGCMLHLLQSDLLALRDRGEAEGGAQRIAISEADNSIGIHACHSAIREVEVLHDQLVELLSDPRLGPQDIIVMTPDIEAYAPMIDAVFSESSARPHVPFRIADRGALATHAVLSALAAALDVISGRMPATAVLDLLGLPAVRARFEIAADEVETLRQWVAQSGIRWGVDATHRTQVEQPARQENTWRFGLERLVLGYAMPVDDDQLFCGRSPATFDAGDADLLGRFLDFSERLFALQSELATPCPVTEWKARIERVLSTLIASDADTAHEHQLLRRGLGTLVTQATQAGFDVAIDLFTLRKQLGRMLDARLPAHGFLAGGVTFCQLVPMRSIPFAVVCLLGMHDGAFPATETPLGFDWMAKQPRVGDRSRRDDDRQLFLEALLSARQRLVITYLGQSIYSGKTLAPSVVVSELIDHLARSCSLTGDDQETGFSSRVKRMEERVLLRHPLQAFSPRYFGADQDPRLFSYAHGNCQGASALLGPRAPARPFLAHLAAGSVPIQQLSLGELEAGISHLQRLLLRKRLGLRLGDELASLADREPFELDPLSRSRLGGVLLARAQDGADLSTLLPAFRARGSLPLGSLGELAYQGLAAQADELAQLFHAHAQEPKLPVQAVELQIAGVRLSGELADLWPNAQLRVHYARLEGRRELRYWVRHVVLQNLARLHPRAHLPATSVLIGRAPNGEARAIRFLPLADPEACLADLVALYQLGCNAALPVFERASRAYQEKLSRGASPLSALAVAESAFAPERDEGIGDQGDPYVRQVYRDFAAVLDQREPCDFQHGAALLYGPLLGHRQTL